MAAPEIVATPFFSKSSSMRLKSLESCVRYGIEFVLESGRRLAFLREVTIRIGKIRLKFEDKESDFFKTRKSVFR